MKVREALTKIQTELNAPKNKTNTFGHYNYRSCESIFEAVKPYLKECNCTLVIKDELVVSNLLETEIVIVAKSAREVQTARVYIKSIATLTDSDGDSVSTQGFARESSLKTGMDSSQLTGSTSSYSGKRALGNLFCLDDTKDSDATNRHGKEETKKVIDQDEKVKAEVLAISKEKFKTVVMCQSWRKTNGFPEKISDCTNSQLNSMLEKLNEAK